MLLVDPAAHYLFLHIPYKLSPYLIILQSGAELLNFLILVVSTVVMSGKRKDSNFS
jgi:hypothetical protein